MSGCHCEKKAKVHEMVTPSGYIDYRCDQCNLFVENSRLTRRQRLFRNASSAIARIDSQEDPFGNIANAMLALLTLAKNANSSVKEESNANDK